MNPMKRPYRIKWFDPQDKRIVGFQYRGGRLPAKLMKCTLEVGALTKEKLVTTLAEQGIGTITAAPKKIHIALQGKEKKLE